MQFSDDKDRCPCPSISHLPCPPPCPPPSSVKDARSKYCQEIGAEMIDNRLIIRLEKDKSKSRKKRDEWDPPCDCVEIQRPTSKRGPRIINGDRDDRIVFRVHSTSRFQKEDSEYKSQQTIAYKIGPCTDDPDSHQCKTITVYPQSDISGTQEVYSDHITEGGQDIFLLRIKKKAESPDQKHRNVELELRTPKPSIPPPPPFDPAVASPQPAVADLVVEDAKEPEDTKLEKPKAPSRRAKEKKKKK